MFKVKITVVNVLGDEEKYPCHAHHKIGDQIIFDGESYIGKLCPVVWPMVVPKVDALYFQGPRYRPPDYYAPFWYAPGSVKNESKTVYDGRGYINVLKTRSEPKYHMGCLNPPHSFQWPPYPERTINKDAVVICPDTRTAVVFQLEAFDLCDTNFAIPFYRRQMSILSRVLPKPGIATQDILNEFSRQEREDIYPALSKEILTPFLEELVLMDYLEIKNDEAFVTRKGEQKLREFKLSLSDEEIEVLKM